MFKYKEKNGIYLQYLECSPLRTIQHEAKMWTLAVHNSYELIYIRSFEPPEKCTTLKDIFPRLSRTQALISRTLQDQSDFPGLSRSWKFAEKIQDFPGGVGTLV